MGVVRPAALTLAVYCARNVTRKQTVPSAGTIPAFTPDGTGAAQQPILTPFPPASLTLRTSLDAAHCGRARGEVFTTANTSTAWTQIRRINVQHRVNGVRVTGYHRCRIRLAPSAQVVTTGQP